MTGLPCCSGTCTNGTCGASPVCPSNGTTCGDCIAAKCCTQLTACLGAPACAQNIVCFLNCVGNGTGPAQCAAQCIKNPKALQFLLCLGGQCGPNVCF